MSEKLNVRELAFHYLASQHEKLSEEAYLEKLMKAEAEFSRLLESANPPKFNDPLETFHQLGKQA
ncbi:hypothetical protein C2J41_18045 [Salmonella enterica]|uniref:hypothetical protein n=1 Tax=Salmonella enterica TaxID=28901 RepID=UPI00127B69A2|nr:hypothetical protein [Salmonella enterica]ECE0889786.1 hypothetical protein [Salmonella enterica subsp. diarizonae]ECE1725295.1 hypothetical protein [Salmonella enterica]ECI5277896.1 hypothetical protein [Salmonella enterica subsp. diarizonae]EDK8462680.1 hypothetical protein [Salmonella enterica subsp. diarizonae]